MVTDPEYGKYREQINKFIYDDTYSEDLKAAQTEIKRVIKLTSPGVDDLQKLIDALWEYLRLLQKKGYILDGRVMQTHFTMPYWDGDIASIREVYREKSEKREVWWVS